jgi:hypothetical protein
MNATPNNKEVSAKSTTAARVAATSGPAATAAEIRKNKKRKARKQTLPPHYQQSTANSTLTHQLQMKLSPKPNKPVPP